MILCQFGFSYILQGISLQIKEGSASFAYPQMAQNNDGPKKDPCSNKRKTEEDKTARLMKKRTLQLGEVDSSSEEEMDKLDRLFPRWWEDDQHLAGCECDFCNMYYKASDRL